MFRYLISNYWSVRQELLALPGIGDYTAAAVLAFAFSRSTVVLDTNVRRVLARWLAGAALGGLLLAIAAWLEQVQDPPLFMNSVGGLGSPWWHEGLQPAFTNNDTAYSDAERAVAVAESIVFLLQHNLERIGRLEVLEVMTILGSDNIYHY